MRRLELRFPSASQEASRPPPRKIAIPLRSVMHANFLHERTKQLPGLIVSNKWFADNLTSLTEARI
jgi:hypothetical protein